MGPEWLNIPEHDDMDIPSVPPGFTSRTTFTLKRIDNREETCCSMAFGSAFVSEPAQVDSACDVIDIGAFKASFRHRPWMVYDQCNENKEESDFGLVDTSLLAKNCLPKAVADGCPNCLNDPKVTSSCHSEEAGTNVLEDTLVFYPTKEEFRNTIEYIASIRSKAEQYGICRIVPPPSWQPPCLIKEKEVWEGSKFVTQVQRIGLQNHYMRRKMSNLHEDTRRKRKRSGSMDLEHEFDGRFTTKSCEVGCCETMGLRSEPGPEFTLENFEKYADDFDSFFFKKDKIGDANISSTFFHKGRESSAKNIESEYWRIVENSTEDIEVLCGADLDTKVFGTGFPVASNPANSPEYIEYVVSGWNLNNISKLPGSLLSFENCDMSGALVPRLHIGMCFSSYCWKVEEHHLYSLCYMHFGAPRTWYGISGEYYFKFEAALKKYFPDLLAKQPELLHKLVIQLSPFTIKSNNIPVYRCIQNPGEFVLILPGAYYSAFNCGFNCVEEVNFAPVDWLPHGQNVVELYREQGRKTLIAHDKLLLGAAREIVRAQCKFSNNLIIPGWKNAYGKDGILTKALKSRIKWEAMRRKYLCASSQSQKMDKEFDSVRKRECSICLYDLHLSAAGCPCSPDRYSCLNHAKQLCSCEWSTRIFLFRHEISELNVLVEALEGNIGDLHGWPKENPGCSPNSKDDLKVTRLVGDLSSFPKASKQDPKSHDEPVPHGILTSTKLHSEMKAPLENKEILQLKLRTPIRATALQKEKLLENRSASPTVTSAKKEALPSKIPARDLNIAKYSNTSSGVDPLSNSAPQKQTADGSLSCNQSIVILLSDDES